MRIILRADGNSQIGLGHVMRLLGLGEVLRPYFSLYFAIQKPTPALKALFKKAQIEIMVLPVETNFEREAIWLKHHLLQPHDVLVLDGYHFNQAYQEHVRSKVTRLFCLDDLHAFPIIAHVVVNPAGGVTENQYQLGPGTQLLTGPDYALLREPFLVIAQTYREVKTINRILVNFGGADPGNYTLQVLQEIRKASKPWHLEVVLGSAYLNVPELERFIRENQELTINLHQNLSAEAMCALMLTCDAAVCSPSTVAYEWCCARGPLFLIRTADNQRDLEQFLLNEKLSLPFSQFFRVQELPDKEAIYSEQVQQQRKYFYGQSTLKWRQLFFKQVYPAWLTFRTAQLSDCTLLFNWINEPEVRQYSLNPAPVPLDIHISWFQKKIQEENSFIFIAELGPEPVGMIRFDVTGSEALISYLVDKTFRGRGLGTALLTKGMAAFTHIARVKADKISGLVQKLNIASVKAFERAGFTTEIYNDSRHPSLIKFSLNLPGSGAV